MQFVGIFQGMEGVGTALNAVEMCDCTQLAHHHRQKFFVFKMIFCLAMLDARRCVGDLERAKGIEPSYEAWEAAVLPLNYARVWMLFILLDALSKHKNSKRFFSVFFLNLRLLAPMD